MNDSDILVRPIHATDRARWEELWKGYQVFYKAHIPVTTTDLTFGRFFAIDEPMYAFVAERDGTIVGIVHFIFHRSTWTEGPYCYLQDLFTDESAPGSGVGRALIEAVYARAREERASRVYWLTHETNTVAMQLYDKIAERSGFVQYRKLL